jgi:uncharacterized repeat protein (TIGR03803 family)
MRSLIATAIFIASFAAAENSARAGEFGKALGGAPFAGLIRDNAGNLNGTEIAGGEEGDGLVFQLSPDNVFTQIYNIGGGYDGALPQSDLLEDASNNLYGTAQQGGPGTACPSGCGTLYRVTLSGDYTVLHYFLGGSDGALPTAGIVMDADGNIYGTTPNGGGACSDPNGCGVVFKLTPGGVETILHAFTNGSDGGYPRAGVILDNGGNIYGVAGGGSGTFGNVFKITTNGKFKVLTTFHGGADGGGPYGRLLKIGSAVYGTTNYGGANGYGTVFSVTTAGSETVLHSFTKTDGANPNAGLISDKKHNLYGTTEYGGGGSCNCGTAYKLAPNGQETVLHSFAGGDDDGAYPLGVLLLDKGGNLYGTTYEGFIENGGGMFIITP